MADWKHASVKAMCQDDGPTAPLAEFIEDYEADDNVWWMAASGHHQNLFEAAVAERDDLRALADDLANLLIHAVEAEGGERYVGVEIQRVLARYREARQ